MSDAAAVAFWVIASVGGAGAIIVGASKLIAQYISERMLEGIRSKHAADLAHLENQLSRLNLHVQAQIDRTQVVHRLHFETEFRALRRIWRHIARVRGAMSALRPVVSIGPIDHNPDHEHAQLQANFATFTREFNALINATHADAPFLTPAIDAALSELLKAARREHISIRVHRKDTDAQWWETGEKNFNAFCEEADRVQELIRQRLDELKVLEQAASSLGVAGR